MVHEQVLNYDIRQVVSGGEYLSVAAEDGLFGHLSDSDGSVVCRKGYRIAFGFERGFPRPIAHLHEISEVVQVSAPDGEFLVGVGHGEVLARVVEEY